MSQAVKEMALKYYPTMWDDSRIEALVRADKLTETEADEIRNEKKVNTAPVQ